MFTLFIFFSLSYFLWYLCHIYLLSTLVRMDKFSSYKVLWCFIWHLISEKKTKEDTERWFAKRRRTECNKAGESSCSEPFSTATDTLKPAGGKEEQWSNGTGLGEDDEDEGSTNYVVKRISAFLTETEPYILDIDLDFFSCKNPFKELYTQVHLSVLYYSLYISAWFFLAL